MSIAERLTHCYPPYQSAAQLVADLWVLFQDASQVRLGLLPAFQNTFRVWRFEVDQLKTSGVLQGSVPFVEHQCDQFLLVSGPRVAEAAGKFPEKAGGSSRRRAASFPPDGSRCKRSS